MAEMEQQPWRTHNTQLLSTLKPRAALLQGSIVRCAFKLTCRTLMAEMEQQSRRNMSAFSSSASTKRRAACTTARQAGGGTPSPRRVSSTLERPPSRPCAPEHLDAAISWPALAVVQDLCVG